MASSMLLMPVSEVDRSGPEVAQFFADGGAKFPKDMESRHPTVEDIRECLQKMGWAFEESERIDDDGEVDWTASGDAPSGEYFDLSLQHGGRKGPALGFRIGPHGPAFAIARSIAAKCGPQLAYEPSYGRACVVTADSQLEGFPPPTS